MQDTIQISTTTNPFKKNTSPEIKEVILLKRQVWNTCYRTHYPAIRWYHYYTNKYKSILKKNKNHLYITYLQSLSSSNRSL